MLRINDQEKNQLLSAWQKLEQPERHMVRLFAEFLAQHSQPPRQEQPPIPQEPILLPRPDGESAVMALKRLKKSYPMIDTDFSLLEEASRLLLKKIMGTEDAEVIRELETLFATRYRVWKDGLGC
ncbi:MAG: hypothetical protein H7837_01015 [Magnetococcus sp. MYC-9]